MQNKNWNEWLKITLEENLTRLEVIGPDGREYVRYFEPDERMHHLIQDDGRTLKIFIEGTKNERQDS